MMCAHFTNGLIRARLGVGICAKPHPVCCMSRENPEVTTSSGHGVIPLCEHARRERIELTIYLKDTPRAIPLSVVKDSPLKKAIFLLSLSEVHYVDGESGRALGADLPEGLTPERVISDYLRELSRFIMTVVQSSLGSHITVEDVQWCLCVPAVWGDGSKLKEKMDNCASIAGMTKGSGSLSDSIHSTSPYPLIVVHEREAAAFYSRRVFHFPRENFLVVDVDGGTVNLVSHEKVGVGLGLKVESCPYTLEVSPTSQGGLCGGYVDKAFFDFLSRAISCFQVFALTRSDSVLKLKHQWDSLKYEFDGCLSFPKDLELPAPLSRAWEEDETSSNRFSTQTVPDYDAITLDTSDMLDFFDPVVNGILALIKMNMIEGLNGMVIVGGFSSSKYLVNRIRETFSAKVSSIYVPPEPSRVICSGAVCYGIHRILQEDLRDRNGLT